MTRKQNRLLHNESVPVIARLFPIENGDTFFPFPQLLPYLVFPFMSLKALSQLKKMSTENTTDSGLLSQSCHLLGLLSLLPPDTAMPVAFVRATSLLHSPCLLSARGSP